ncbi:hypothetical protein [Kibdelosporangium phytohabitans]|uniref:Uncharacterized protein n=1 Tax=Kibdelosporangium phytohabitans TaxID=860235 RepID=A0A0N7F3F2_9PSEU|nr:hypothetical protein [Kibdelosporangium phytohabitans]ALG08463.1 hypothetical protein AOZ06_17460 [Kibdelosporangium phytohabitans]MBE1470476.1 sugar phosphate permease [Kibdelosporangium phytohabitans]
MREIRWHHGDRDAATGEHAACGTAAGRAILGNLVDEHGAAGAFPVAPITAAVALVLAVTVTVADRNRGRWLPDERPAPELTNS